MMIKDFKKIALKIKVLKLRVITKSTLTLCMVLRTLMKEIFCSFQSCYSYYTSNFQLSKKGLSFFTDGYKVSDVLLVKAIRCLSI